MKKTIYKILALIALSSNVKAQCTPTFPTAYSASSTTICAGQSVTLTPNSIGALGGAGYFQWYTSGPSGSFFFGPQTSFCGSITTATLAAGTHIFKYGANGGSCGGPTAGIAQIAITVVGNPTVSVANGSMCTGSNYTITPSGATSYTYLTTGFPSANGNSLVVSPPAPALPAGNRTYTIIGSVGPGCISNTTMNLNITQTPTISVASATTICSGQQFNLSATGATNYTVTTTAGTQTLSGPYSFGLGLFNPTVSTTYSVIGITNQCASSNSVITSVTVNPTPTITASNGSICAGSNFTITPSGATSYTYSSGSAVVAPTTNSVYIVTGANGNCTSTKNVSVSVNPLPSTVINSGNPSFVACAGSNVTIPTNAGNPSFYSTINGNPTTLNSSFEYTINATQSQTYGIVVTNTLTGCFKALTTVTITVPSATLLASTSNSNLCLGQSAVLSVSLSSGSTPLNPYTWYPGAFGTGNSSVTINPTITTIYTVTAQDQAGNGCNFFATIVQNVSTCTGIYNSEFNSRVNIYPNPAKDNLTIDLSEVNENTSLELISSLGQLVLTEKNIFNKTMFNLGDIPNGIYFLKISNGNESKTHKIIKN